MSATGRLVLPECHPCNKAHKALNDAGYEPRVVRTGGCYGADPLWSGRRAIKRLTGSYKSRLCFSTVARSSTEPRTLSLGLSQTPPQAATGPARPRVGVQKSLASIVNPMSGETRHRCGVGEIPTIRHAEPCEWDILGDLHRRSSFVWAEDRGMLEAHPDALGVASDAIVKRRVRVAASARGELLGSSVVAFAGLDVCELDDLFVDPDYMRQGIGRALVEDAASNALAAGCETMTVVAHPRKFPFYERVDFDPRGGRVRPRKLDLRPRSRSRA